MSWRESASHSAKYQLLRALPLLGLRHCGFRSLDEETHELVEVDKDVPEYLELNDSEPGDKSFHTAFRNIFGIHRDEIFLENSLMVTTKKIDVKWPNDGDGSYEDWLKTLLTVDLISGDSARPHHELEEGDNGFKPIFKKRSLSQKGLINIQTFIAELLSKGSKFPSCAKLISILNQEFRSALIVRPDKFELRGTITGGAGDSSCRMDDESSPLNPKALRALLKSAHPRVDFYMSLMKLPGKDQCVGE